MNEQVQTEQRGETMRDIVVAVYAAGLAPLARRLVRRWRGVAGAPASVVVALLTTAATVPAMAIYAFLATLVPLTVVFLLIITAPVTIWVTTGQLLRR